MAVNFAPYQSSPPESERARSPPLRSPNASPRPQRTRPQQNLSSIADQEDPWAAARNQRLPSPSQYAADDEGYTDLEGASREPLNDYFGREGPVFETSLGLPLRIEACLAYLVIPPAGGIILLLFEHKSDYVRYHAWQSSLLFSAIVLLHIIFSWSSVISYMLLVCDLSLILFLTYGAYRNAETLDRVEIPLVGRLASSFVDEE
ncbi:uncharacterized protein K489DRAFT_367304 [Dissoconium aciculare CBS 342.82]|jgi:uncharacterized membrane protein|uniref:Uncharacterized protein n=1 Tax=Dissoconium aciculare CBS 342.82 TaxID=1314786 RepID=A0A6J3MEK1_9PEZI|nr:uncharacterized protein K489DRAFT_367304 [Dissoconium aciculare CBS 342.82]KAF1826039.1 hypothetical protein K489DRAFT_367304 [Dissoconium aciculare CBS 342.82]